MQEPDEVFLPEGNLLPDSLLVDGSGAECLGVQLKNKTVPDNLWLDKWEGGENGQNNQTNTGPHDQLGNHMGKPSDQNL